MTLSLYYFPFSCSLVPYVSLTEANAHFNVEVVNLQRGEQMRPEFLRLNPKHKVPVLVIDGKPLSENVAMLIWIAKNFPDAKLLPSGLGEYEAISLLAWCASGIHPSLTPNARPQRYCDEPGSEDSVRRCAQKLTHENFAVAESLLRGREYFFDHFTVPDAYFFWCFRSANMFKIDVSAYPNCQAHFERMLQRPSVKTLLAFEASVLAQQAKAS